MDLPVDVREAWERLRLPGETVEFSAPAGERWAVLTPLALYVGAEEMNRYPRGWIAGVEFDRGAAGPGAMVLVGRDGILDSLTFSAPERPGMVELEARLATGNVTPPAPVVASAPPKRAKGITIVLDQPDFAPSEHIRGAVVVDWPKDAPVRGIRVGVAGSEDTRISVSKGSGRNRRTVTYREHNPILGEEIVLFGREPVGFFRGLGEGMKTLVGKLKHPVLKRGRHEYAFDFRLPSRALPSHAGPHAAVAYRITANVDVPLGFDLVTEGPLRVLSPRGTRLSGGTASHRSEATGLLKGFKADVSLEAEVRGTTLRPGAPLEGRIRVENRSHKKIARACFSLRRLERAEASVYVRDADDEVLSGDLRVPDPAAKEFEAVFGMVLPPEACAYEGRHSEVGLALDVALDIAWSFDVKARVPLTVER